VEKQRTAGKKVVDALKRPVARVADADVDLAGVELESPIPVSKQLDAQPFPQDLVLTEADFAEFITPTGLIDQFADNTKLNLRLRKVTCVKDTREIGKDEIAMGGTRLEIGFDAAGATVKSITSKLSEIEIGQFVTGDVINLSPPRVFASFNLNNGTQFPKSFLIAVAMAEKDFGGFAKFLDELVKAIGEEVKKQLEKALKDVAGAGLGALAGTVIGGVIGAVIGALVGFVVGAVVQALIKLFGDEIFQPISLTLDLDSADSVFPNGQTTSPESQLTFQGFGGTYRVAYDFNIVS
jgi:hypothetical protein